MPMLLGRSFLCAGCSSDPVTGHRYVLIGMNAHHSQRRDGLGLPRAMPCPPAGTVYPSMTLGLGPKRQQRIARTLSTSAFQAAAERGHSRVTVKPFNHTMVEGLSL